VAGEVFVRFAGVGGIAGTVGGEGTREVDADRAGIVGGEGTQEVDADRAPVAGGVGTRETDVESALGAVGGMGAGTREVDTGEDGFARGCVADLKSLRSVGYSRPS